MTKDQLLDILWENHDFNLLGYTKDELIQKYTYNQLSNILKIYIFNQSNFGDINDTKRT